MNSPTDDPILGIDLGTTNSVIAMLEGGDPEVLPNKEGDRTTPSVVAKTEAGEELIGNQAKHQAVQNPDGTVESIKREMGADDSEVTLHGESFTPEEISAKILRKLKADAERAVGHDLDRAVITVPAHFSHKQRQATKDAGEIAGFQVERIINEPTAAAMAYGLDNGDNETVMVFDLGGGTFDVSILEITADDTYEVVATSGDTNLGGDDWDQAIIDWLLLDFESETGIDLREDLEALQRVRDAAEEAKNALSTRETTHINLPYIAATDDGESLHIDKELPRERFEELTEPLVERTEAPIADVLDEGGYTRDELDEILLVGGATRIPMIREQFENPLQTINPDEAVAMGAAIQGGIIDGRLSDPVLLDVTPLSLGIETEGGLFKPLIDANTTIPTEASEIFSTAHDNQTSVDIRVFQGEREIAEENEFLGEFMLSGIPPAPAGTPEIRVAFEIDEDGLVTVEARDHATGHENAITIEGGVGLPDEKIEQLREEAAEHADEDQRRKDRIAAQNRAEEAIQHASTLLNDGKVPQDEQARIRELRSQLEAQLEEDEANVDVAQLKQTTKELGEALHQYGAETLSH